MKLKQIILLSVTSIVVGTSSITISKAHSLQFNQNQTIIAQSQPLTDQGPRLMMSGQFVAGEKPTTGTARIVNEGGLRFLELRDDFSTSNQGPDLHVLLDDQSRPPHSYQNLEGTINLGKLKSFNGKQRYLISDMIDIRKVKSVVIWCQTANATFGYAPLIEIP